MSRNRRQRDRAKRVFKDSSMKKAGKGLRWRPKHEVDLQSSGAAGPEAAGDDNMTMGAVAEVLLTQRRVDENEAEAANEPDE